MKKKVSAVDPDIGRILDEWPFQPGKLNVRLITLPSGDARIQVRLDLGIIQMHAEGRPDGQRPNGFESLLDMYEHQFDETTGPKGQDKPEVAGAIESPESGDSESGDATDATSLTPDQCQELRDEAVQYYHRYMALMALEDYEGVVRDTTRNLRVLDLCAQHAQSEQDREALEQYRPYITMIRARAAASQAIKDNEPKAALLAIDEGLEVLKKYFADQGEPDGFDQSSEVQMLRGMRDSLVPKLPVSQRAELKTRLQQALNQENYELAAILRDELKLIEKQD